MIQENLFNFLKTLPPYLIKSPTQAVASVTTFALPFSTAFKLVQKEIYC